MDTEQTADLVGLPDGRRAQLWEGGAPAGPVVFFFHGCPDSRLAACPGDAAARRAGVRLVAVSRPGYGRSDPCPFGHVSIAHDTVAIAKRLGIDRFAVLGMSLGGPYALACAALHPDQVTAVGVAAAPAITSELDPPFHRDDLTPVQQKFFARAAGAPVEEAVELFRPDYEDFVASVNPDDGDDTALARRWTDGLHPQDMALLASRPVADVAASAREALANADGYLYDAAVTFRDWQFRPEQVRCSTWLWYGELDSHASVRNGSWFAEHIPDATLVIRPDTSHLATLAHHWDDILTTLHP